MAYDWWLTPAVYSSVAIVTMEARLSHAEWKDGKLLFRLPLLFRIGIVGTASTLIYLAHRDWASEEWWVNLLGCTLIFSFLLGWPPVVLISKAGIERRLWWKPKIFIPWDQLVDAEINRDGDMILIGMDASMSCSRFQNDPERFQAEVIARSKVKRFHAPERLVGLHLESSRPNGPKTPRGKKR